MLDPSTGSYEYEKGKIVSGLLAGAVTGNTYE